MPSFALVVIRWGFGGGWVMHTGILLYAAKCIDHSQRRVPDAGEKYRSLPFASLHSLSLSLSLSPHSYHALDSPLIVMGPLPLDAHSSSITSIICIPSMS